MNMSKEWYDMIAMKNNGYKSNAIYSIEGLSGEDEFEKRVIAQLSLSNLALDAGCGDGEFTIKMGQYANHIIGFDNSEELLKLAKGNLQASKINNVHFEYGWTKDLKALPFKDEAFDFIYCRRGPTSILNHSRILKSGGMIIGIHTAEYERVLERLKENGFENIEIDVFDQARAVFPNENEFIKYLSAFPGNPDYSLPEYEPVIKKIIEDHTVEGKIVHKQWRYIWKAIKP